jgi:hypothetical protein
MFCFVTENLQIFFKYNFSANLKLNILQRNTHKTLNSFACKAVDFKIINFWNVFSCRLVNNHQIFGGT